MPVKAKPAKAPTPRGSGRLTFSVGLVNVEVRTAPLMSADRAPRARTLCAEHLEPIKTAHYCPSGDHYTDETAMAFERDGCWVTGVDRDAAAAERDGQIELAAVVPVAEIDPLYYEKTYLVWPGEGAGNEQAFDVIAAQLARSGEALTGRAALSKSTRMVVLRYSQAAGCLLLHVCQFDANVRWGDVKLVADGAATRVQPTEQHLAMVEQLLGTLEGEFEPAGDDDYTAALEELIEAAATGKPIEAKPQTAEAAPVGDLMAALQASVEAAKATAPAKKKRERVAA